MVHANTALKKIYSPMLIIYLTALYTTLAGMEIFATALSLLSLYAVIIKERTFKWPPPPLSISLILLWITVGVGLWLNEVPNEIFRHNFFKFRWIVEFILLTNLLRVFFSSADLKKVQPWLDTVILIILSYSIYQFLYGKDFFRPGNVLFHHIGPASHFFRPNGFFGVTLTLASSVGMYFCWSLSRLLYQTEVQWSRRHLLNIASCSASVLIICISFTRGSWIATLLAAIAIVIFYNKRLIRYFIPGIIALFTLLWFTFPEFKDRIKSFDELTNANHFERIKIWRANWAIVQDYPIFGIGFDENKRRIQTYYDRLGTPDTFISHAHNTFLDFFAGTGFLGLLFYSIFIVFLFVYSLRLYRSYKRQPQADPAIMALTLAFLGMQLIIHISGLTECTFRDKELNHQFIFFAALTMAIAQIESRKMKS